MKLKFTVILSALLLVITFFIPKLAFAANYTLSGHVQNSSGIAVDGATVDVKNPSTNAVVATTTTDGSGDYSVNAAEGTYNIQVTPQPGSGLSLVIAVNQVISGNKTINFVLAPTGSHTFSGHIYNSENTPLTNQTVSLRDPDTNAVIATTTTDANGFYSVALQPNIYKIQITAKNSQSVNAPRFYNLLLSEYTFTQSTYIDFVLPFKKVDVHVEDDVHANFADVELITSTDPTNASLSVSGISASLVVSYYDSGTSGVGPLPKSDTSGNSTLWLFPTGSNDPYTFIAKPPTGSGFATTNLTNMFITGNTSKTITMQKLKNLTGHLYDSEGGILPSQTIALREPGSNSLIASTTTDSNGYYSLSAIPNSYNIQISAANNSTTLKAPKTYNLMIGGYNFTDNSVLDLTIPFKKIELHVQNAFNDPISGVVINTLPTSSVNGVFTVSGMSASISVSYYAAGGANPLPQTDQNGNTTLWLLPNVSNYPYSFVATPTGGSGYSQNALGDNFITSNTSKTITLQKPVILTGKIFNPLGETLADQTVALRRPGTNDVVVSTTTDSQGNYSLSTSADTYTVQITGKNSLNVNAPRFYNLLLSDYALTQTSVLDLTLPFKKIDIHVQNSANQPVGNVEFTTSTAATNASFLVAGLNASSVVSYYDANTTGVGTLPTTDNDGNTSLWLFQNDSNYPYTLFATPQNGSPYGAVLQDIHVSENENKIISLQYNHSAPVTTVELVTQHADGTYSNPATVTLLAEAAEGYTVANTYYKVDGGVQQTYSGAFEVFGDGAHSIEYWSVDNSGLAETHKTSDFTIQVNEAPVVDPFPGATINEGQTFTASSSFTDPDSTSWTATVDYDEGAGPEPLTLNPDKTFNLSHQYTTAGTYDVTVVVKDDSQNTGTTIATVIVNAAPELTMPVNKTVNKDFYYHATGTFTDPDSWSWTATVDYGDGSGLQQLNLDGNSFLLSHAYTVYGTYTATVTITDNQGASVSGDTTVTVNQPTFTAENVVVTSSNISFDITNIDPAYVDTHTTFFALELRTPGNITRYFYNGGYTPNDMSQQASCNALLHCELALTSDGNGTPETYAITLSSDTLNNGINGLTSQLLTWPQPVTATFNASADTYVKGGADNRNTGAGVFMRLQASGTNRSLVRFDQQALAEEIRNGDVLSAKLRLTIVDNGNNWGTTGRTIDVHRLIASWAEGNGTETTRGTGTGATWECAIDSLIENQTKNCSGTTEWEMGQPNNPAVHPWIGTATATQTITNNQTGIVELDVTEDVQAFMNGTSNNGWIIKKTAEGQNGQVSFGTKESSSVPQLVVTYQP